MGKSVKLVSKESSTTDSRKFGGKSTPIRIKITITPSSFFSSRIAFSANSIAWGVSSAVEFVGGPSVAITTTLTLPGRAISGVNIKFRTKSTVSAKAVLPPATDNDFTEAANNSRSIEVLYSVKYNVSAIV